MAVISNPVHTYEKGVVTRILKDGYGYVQAENSVEQYIFSFRVISGYKGQSVKELNLYPGSKVTFKTDGQSVTELTIQ